MSTAAIEPAACTACSPAGPWAVGGVTCGRCGLHFHVGVLERIEALVCPGCGKSDSDQSSGSVEGS